MSRNFPPSSSTGRPEMRCSLISVIARSSRSLPHTHTRTHTESVNTNTHTKRTTHTRSVNTHTTTHIRSVNTHARAVARADMAFTHTVADPRTPLVAAHALTLSHTHSTKTARPQSHVPFAPVRVGLTELVSLCCLKPCSRLHPLSLSPSPPPSFPPYMHPCVRARSGADVDLAWTVISLLSPSVPIPTSPSVPWYPSAREEGSKGVGDEGGGREGRGGRGGSEEAKKRRSEKERRGVTKRDRERDVSAEEEEEEREGTGRGAHTHTHT
eukprot:117800-Rhodomonas_salina.1